MTKSRRTLPPPGMHMKIGVVSQWFAPEPAPIPSTLSKYLSGESHDVKVLTGFPNYPAGRIYSGFRQSWNHRNDEDGFRVRRVPQFVSHDNNGLRRMMSFLTFAVASLLHAAWLRDREVIYVYATPMTVCLSVLYLRWVHRIPYVLHIQDLWPESVLDSGMIRSATVRRFVDGALCLFLKIVYRNASHVVAIAPAMAATLQSRGVQSDKLSVVLNWAVDRPVLHAAESLAFRDRVSSPARWLFLYAGNIGMMQDVETIIRAAALLGRKSDIDFAIVGDGASLGHIKELSSSLGVTNLTFIDRVPFEKMGPVYAAADYQLVTLLDRPVFRGTIPSKVGASLAAGLPIITTVPGDVAAMCVQGGFGWVAEPENAQALAAVCREAVNAGRAKQETMAAAARSYFDDHLSMEAGFLALEAVLAKAVALSER